MSKITNQKILELALNSSDPAIRQTVDKLIFAMKLKYHEEDFMYIYDNYAHHHGIQITMPCMHSDDKQHELAVSWKREHFTVISMEHQIVTGETGDFVCGEEAANIYLPYDYMGI